MDSLRVSSGGSGGESSASSSGYGGSSPQQKEKESVSLEGEKQEYDKDWSNKLTEEKKNRYKQYLKGKMMIEQYMGLHRFVWVKS